MNAAGKLWDPWVHPLGETGRERDISQGSVIIGMEMENKYGNLFSNTVRQIFRAFVKTVKN